MPERAPRKRNGTLPTSCGAMRSAAQLARYVSGERASCRDGGEMVLQGAHRRLEPLDNYLLLVAEPL